MKIFFSQNSKDADAITIEKQNITSTHLMERAATVAFHWIENKYQNTKTTFQIFCGVGNNGGDGLVLARLLKQKGYFVKVNIVSFNEKHSDDFIVNLERLKEFAIEPYIITNGDHVPNIKSNEIVIDAIFGSGLSRTPEEWVIDLFQYINASQAYVIAIDVPSGLFLDQNTENKRAVINAAVVLTFQLPKLAFYLPENERYIQDIIILDIGLDPKFINETPTNHYLIDQNDISILYKSVDQYAHKGTQGHVLVVGGSYGKIGAPLLTAKAALKSGCGLVTTYIPRCGYTALQASVPEVMVLTDPSETHISTIQYEFKPQAIAIGMGMGQHLDTQKALHSFLNSVEAPLLVDADAINILSINRDWISQLPEGTILTPHPKELERLIGSWQHDFEKIEKTQQLAKKHQLIIIIKGAYTLVIDAENTYVNITGNQALATAGSGDVLSGIITSLLAQAYDPIEAAILGVYIHGLTADLTVPETGYQSFIASDIISNIGKAYLHIEA
ncbi:NAD(P)H-hydrate dehydratase [Flavobacterium sp. '19STA2R22 D10 B1']|uniref:NAD(P)H-hydrate dehydratase n=1 Tax=Flavobacterium aerium TaxID=3037261 RepID=UPI00278C803D|nr:NAD(P)H-hydrate dehydratase [Flavobacterium sp. '19STA2R22 D10 B1']